MVGRSAFFAASRPALFGRVREVGLGERGVLPRPSRSARHERGGQGGKEIGLGTCGCEGQTYAAPFRVVYSLGFRANSSSRVRRVFPSISSSWDGMNLRIRGSFRSRGAKSEVVVRNP